MKFKSKKSQLPFIEFDGEEYCDASFIIKELCTRFNVNLDGSLNVQQRSLTSFAVAMLENHFSWVLKAWRSTNPNEMLKAYNIDLQKVTGKTWPNIILNFVYKCQQKKLAQTVVAHGIGVHTPKEIEGFGQDDLQVLSDLLGEQDYLFGENTTSLDVVAFAHLSQLVYMDSEVECGLRDWLRDNCPNLVDLCDRLKEKAFPDWEDLLKTKEEEPEIKEDTEEMNSKQDDKKDKKEKKYKEDKKGKKGKEDKKEKKDKEDKGKERQKG